MGVARQHLYRLDPLAADLELQNFIGIQPALADQAAPGHNDEKFPLAVVPVLALGNAGLGNVHAALAAVFGFQQLGTAAALVCVDF